MPVDGELEKLRINKSERARRGERSWWPWTLVVLLLLGAGAGGWFWKKRTAVLVVETLQVRVPQGAVTESDLVLLSATGYVAAAAKIELASRVVGRVAWVGVEIADKIEKGQELVRLEDDEYKARVAQEQGQLDAARAKLAELEAGSRPQEIAQEQAAVDRAKAELTDAELNYERLKGLDVSGAVRLRDVDEARTLAQSRKAQLDLQLQRLELVTLGPRVEQIAAQRAVVRQLEGSLALSQIDLKNTVIRSTIAGTVLERNVEVGEFVTTGFVGDRGAKGYVVSIADLDDLRVELDVSQNDFAKVRVGQPCSVVTDAYPDKKYDGVVYLIAPEANRQKATVQVRVKVLNPDALLKPEMNATVSFLSQDALDKSRQSDAQASVDRPAIRVPSSAVRDGVVYVVEAGLAMRRTVTLGSVNPSGEVEIRRGLSGGEDVILNPPDGLSEAQPIRIKK